MIARINSLFQTALAAYLAASDETVDYVAMPIWDFNTDDYHSGNPIMFLALPLSMSENVSKSGAKSQHYIAELYFFIQGNLTDNQTPRTIRVDRMKALSDAVIDTYLSENSYITLSSKRSHEDVYNFNDAGFDGVRVILEFDYVDTCLAIDAFYSTYGDNILLYHEWENNEGQWSTTLVNARRRLIKANIDESDEYFLYLHDHDFEVFGNYLLSFDYHIQNGNFKVFFMPDDQPGEELVNLSAEAGKFVCVINITSELVALNSAGIKLVTSIAETGASEIFVGYIHNPTLRKIV
jgi:hypothetical protein